VFSLKILRQAFYETYVRVTPGDTSVPFLEAIIYIFQGRSFLASGFTPRGILFFRSDAGRIPTALAKMPKCVSSLIGHIVFLLSSFSARSTRGESSVLSIHSELELYLCFLRGARMLVGERHGREQREREGETFARGPGKGGPVRDNPFKSF